MTDRGDFKISAFYWVLIAAFVLAVLYWSVAWRSCLLDHGQRYCAQHLHEVLQGKYIEWGVIVPVWWR